MDKGETKEVIKLIEENSELLERVTLYPTLKFYILNQLAEAQLKEGLYGESLRTLEASEACASNFYKDEENSFFANLKGLRAATLSHTKASPIEVEKLFNGSLSTFERIFSQEDDFHRGQGLGKLFYGQFLVTQKRYQEAKTAFEKSEKIFNTILKNPAIDDVSRLYASFAVLGMDMIEEELTQLYLNRHIQTFGVSHSRTEEILITLDRKGLEL